MSTLLNRFYPEVEVVAMAGSIDEAQKVGDSDYSFIFLIGGEKIHSSKTLGDFEELLANQPSFFRVHKTLLVNMEHVVKLIKTECGYLEMSDGSQVEISRRRKAEVLQLLGFN